MARYRFLAYDITGTEFRAEIPFSTYTFEDVLNRPGSLDASLPARAAEAAQVTLDPGRTIIVITNGNDIVWAGIVWAWRRDLSDAPEVRIAGQGLWSYYREGRRTIRADNSFTAADQLSIALLLLTQVHDTANPLDLTVNLNPATSGVNRTISYLASDRKPIGEAIEQLAEMDDGFDLNTRTVWNTDVTPPVPASSLEIWYPHAGSITGVVWQHGTDILLEPVESDATKLATVIDAIGSGPTYATATDSSGEFPYLEGTVSMTDTSDATILANAAAGELARRKSPPTTLSAQILDSSRWPLGSFTLGDWVWISCQDNGVNLDGYWRIVGWKATGDPNGQDVVTVTLSNEATP